MKVIVIGGAGYIGSQVVIDLLELGHEVSVFDNLSTGFIENVPKEVKFYKGDILNEKDLKSVFLKGFDCVMHFAALKAAGESMIKPTIYSSNNITGSINVLNAMVQSKIDKIIFSSSAAVYGDPQFLPITEEHPLLPINYYGYTKLCIEQLLKWYSKLTKIRFCSLRYFNAAGYSNYSNIKKTESSPQNLLPIIMEVLIGKRKKLQIFGNDYSTQDGTCIRDYVHVTDLSNAHIKAMNYLCDYNNSIAINLGGDRGYSIFEIIKQIKVLTGVDITFEITNRRKGDMPILVSDSSLAEKTINWKAQNSSLELLIRSMIKMYQKVI